MAKEFNITGICDPKKHYMVDIQSRLAQIKSMIDDGKYFSINKGRQYGKTTTLNILDEYLSESYIVVHLDFQALEKNDFKDMSAFVSAFSREILDAGVSINKSARKDFKELTSKKKTEHSLTDLFVVLRDWCNEASKPIVLMIDEVDSASNNEVFIDFLARLRYYYLNRDKKPTFQSVVLAGVYDIRNLKKKFVPDGEHQRNSPWNIAAKFDVDMSFSSADIARMLEEYETDYHTGMDISAMAQMIYDDTSGYPVLVSSFCYLMDKEIAGTEKFPTKSSAWTKEGFLRAEKILLTDKTPLFESLIDKLKDNESLRNLLYRILFDGRSIPYNADNDAIDVAAMYGFVTNQNGQLAIFNRIFETRIYEWFLSVELTSGNDFSGGNKNQFVENGKLNMERVLEKFVSDFDFVYGSRDDKFKEEVGRRLFLLYLKPIINGTGFYHIESRTRDERRMDVVVDYGTEQHIIELKIWHGEQYNCDGEKQLSDYLDYHHLKKGYLLTFNFNKKKEIGVKHIQYGDKDLVEATV